MLEPPLAPGLGLQAFRHCLCVQQLAIGLRFSMRSWCDMCGKFSCAEKMLFGHLN